MNKIIILGTGHAVVTKCYNTCFLIQNNDEFLLVDTGGGNKVLEQLNKVEVDITKIHDVFITHNHFDHMIGVFWIIRFIVSKIKSGAYQGNLRIYTTKYNENLIKNYTLGIYSDYIGNYFDNRINFVEISGNMKLNIIGNTIEILDLKSDEVTQYGFKMTFSDEKKLSFFGDIPFNDLLFDKTVNSDWIIHEAFCLDSQKEKYKPHEKHHSTVKDACLVAKKINAKNLILLHTEDDNLNNRKLLYVKESKMYYCGKVFVPNDLEIIDIDEI